MASLVGVHGVGHFYRGRTPSEASSALANTWRKDISEGPFGPLPDGTSLTVAYYAQHVQRPGRQSAHVTLDSIELSAKLMIQEWLELWDLDPGIRQGIATMPLRQAIGIVADHFGFARPIIETFIAIFFSEVDRYLAGNTSHRSAARADVATVIAAAARPRVVIAHSLGSVVTYEALTEYPHLEVDLLVTMGSPLGLVFNKLYPSDGRFPPGVSRWVNIADKGDLIAVPPEGIARLFSDVEQLQDVSIDWADFHLASNYLQTYEIARLIRPFVG